MTRGAIEERFSQEIAKALPRLQKGWYVKEVNGTLSIRERGGKRRRVELGPWSAELEEYLKNHETEDVKKWRAGREQKPPNQSGYVSTKEEKIDLGSFVAKKLDREVPLVKNILAKLGFMQNGFYDLGVMTFFRLSQTPGLINDKLWRVMLSERPSDQEVQEMREKFVNVFDEGITKLIRSQNKKAAEEFVALDYQLLRMQTKYEMEKVENMKNIFRANYYESCFKTAQTVMCARDSQELVRRLVMSGYITGVTQPTEKVWTERVAQATDKGKGSPANLS